MPEYRHEAAAKNASTPPLKIFRSILYSLPCLGLQKFSFDSVRCHHALATSVCKKLSLQRTMPAFATLVIAILLIIVAILTLIILRQHNLNNAATPQIQQDQNKGLIEGFQFEEMNGLRCHWEEE